MKKIIINQNGITLITLVIIIVIILILASVSIGMVTRKDGLIVKSKYVMEEARGADVEEEKNMWKLCQNMDEYTSTTSESLQDLINRLVNKGLLTNDEKEQILGNEEKGIEATGQVTIGSRTIVFEKEGKSLVQAFKDGEIKVGDYITNYNQKLKNPSAVVELKSEETGHIGTQKYQVDATTTWRVLGLSRDGTQLMITTGSPIKKVMNPNATEEWEKNPYLYLSGGEGYYCTNDEMTNDNILDRICKIYDSSLAAKTQSIRIEDINTALGLTLDKENNKLYKTVDGTKLSIQSYQGFFGQSYTYKLEDYAPENYLKEKYPSNSEYQRLTTQKIGHTVDGTAFMFAYDDPSVIDQSSKLYDILFKGTNKKENYAKSYWLASPGVRVVGSSYCIFGPGTVNVGYAVAGSVMFRSGGYSITMWLAVRPVVYLMSDVTVNDLKITNIGKEEEWTTSIPDSYTGENLYYGKITN